MYILRTSVPSVFFSKSVLLTMFSPLGVGAVVFIGLLTVVLFGEDVTVVLPPLPLVTDTFKLLLSRFFSTPVDQSA